MSNITDLLSLGEDYTVTDPNGNVINVIQIITMAELLSAGIGPYNEDTHRDYGSYLKESIERFSGFGDINPNKVLWYSTYNKEVGLSSLIEYAILNGYDKIILEYLVELE